MNSCNISLPLCPEFLDFSYKVEAVLVRIYISGGQGESWFVSVRWCSLAYFSASSQCHSLSNKL